MSGRGNPSSDRQVSDLRPPTTANESAPDPTAGERVCGYPEHEHAGRPEDANGDSTPVGCTVCPATPDADDASRCASSHDGHPCGMCDASEPLTEDEREALLSVERDEDAVAVVERIKAAAATKARADERERIARAIEEEASRSPYRDPYAATEAYLDAARIARGDA